jgi:lysophospholipase L1-like esterase
MTSDRGDIGALLASFGAAAACVALTWLVPGLEAYRPWEPGRPLPVVRALWRTDGQQFVEDSLNGITATTSPVEAGATAPPETTPEDPTPPEAEPTSPVLGQVASADQGGGSPLTAPPTERALPPAAPAPAPPQDAADLPRRPPGVATHLVDPEHRGMDAFYRALHATTQGAGLARAAHWGDSTIAADGITAQVRKRLQARFGNGGPGYLSAGMDPRWNIRKDVSIQREGTWDTVSLLLGGGNGRYGFGGIVSTASADATLSISAPKGSDGKPVPMHHFEVWYQGGVDRGSWWATVDGTAAGGGSAAAAAAVDLRHTEDFPAGYTRVTIGATGGSVPFYGVVMETAGPGVVWDALGVVGVGSRSFTQHSRRHLSAQVAQRDPDLVVVMLGGNELGLPALGKGNGDGYIPYFSDTVRRLRAGAPNAGCLLLTPVDQGTREGGDPRTKPNLPRLVDAQRRAAEAEGCAFWNTWHAMGGDGAIVRWSLLKPPLAWTDLNHLSKAGQDIIGNLLADAIEAGYDAWVGSGGPSRPPPAPPTPEAE